jgi:hypothetical protein
MTDDTGQTELATESSPEKAPGDGMPWWKRYRYQFIAGGSLVVLIGLLASDPDSGLSTGAMLLGIGPGLIAVLAAHLSRKALFDYPEADLRELFKRGREHPVGAAVLALAIAIVAHALLGLFGPRAHAQVPDPRALPFAATIRAETATHWPDLPWPHYPAALIAHESGCPGLRSCWSPTARLRTHREEGAGLGQITRAWRPDGSLRFDALTDLASRHLSMRGATWSNIYTRPDYQIRGVVLLARENWTALRLVDDHWERLAMSNAAYNGGLGGVSADRRMCQVKAGCDPQRWWGHVELTCSKSKAPMYGKRSACDINRDHGRHVIVKELPKYRRLSA